MKILFKIILTFTFIFGIFPKAPAQEEVKEYNRIMIDQYRDGKYDDEIVTGFKIIDIDPEYTHAYTLCGFSYRMINIFPKAIYYLTKAVEISPKIRTFLNLATIHSELGHDSLAIDLYGKILEINPEYFHAYNNRGGSYLQLHKLPDAKADIEKAMELDPFSPHSNMNMGNVNTLFENYEDALMYFEETISLNPLFVNAIYSQGDIYEELGDLEKAYDCYKRTIPIYTKKINSNYYDYTAVLGRAKTYQKIGENELAEIDFKKALPMCDEMVEQNPDSWTMLNSRAQAYYGLKEYDKAAADYQAVLTLNPFRKPAARKLEEINKLKTE